MVQVYFYSGVSVEKNDIGDFVGACDSGVHPGYSIVGGSAWDGPVTSNTLKIIDVSGVDSKSYIYRKVADYIASSFGYPGTPQALLFYPNGVTFDTDQFTSSVNSSLNDVGRASMDFDDLWDTFTLGRYATSANVEAVVTDNYTLDASDIPYF